MFKEQIQANNVFLIRDFLSASECDEYIARCNKIGFEKAPINTMLGAVMCPTIRNNSRVMVDDDVLACKLFERAKEFLPQTLNLNWQLKGFNERLRYYCYEPGQKFAPHYDGDYRRNHRERSKLTFMLYLNDGYAGGCTKFYHDPDYVVRPVRGTALVFVHRKLHEGAEVISGTKYVLRTDVLYAC